MHGSLVLGGLCANHDVFVLLLDVFVDLFVDVALDFTRNLDLG